jgi:aryl-phospho-beta-D-glucosidase BglC (GH1 family)
MRRLNFTPRFFVLLIALVALAACSGSPQVIYITPTAQGEGAATALSTLESVQQPASGTTATRPPLVVGPVVGAQYTLPPSNTPVPTGPPTETVPPRPSTQTPGPTVTSSPPPQVQPSETPLPVEAGPPTAIPSPIPELDNNRVGVQLASNMGRAEWDAALTRSKELGVTWIKVQLNWSFVQPNGLNPDEPLMRLFEQNVQSAENFGFNVLISIAKAPGWTRNGDIASGPPGDPASLAAFIEMLFTQTDIGNTVEAIEIWNEPNLRSEWETPNYEFNGAGYMRLFDPAYQMIRRFRQDVVIVSAGLAPVIDTDGSRDDRSFLQEMYNAGLGRYPDVVVGAHPYGWSNAPETRCCDPSPARGWDDNPHFFYLDNIDATRDIMNRGGHSSVQIWVTEFGWTTWQDLGGAVPDPQEANLWMAELSPQVQADYTLRALEIGLNRGDIGVMFLWNLNFANPFTLQGRDQTAGYSLLILAEDAAQYTAARPLFYLLPQALIRRNNQ